MTNDLSEVLNFTFYFVHFTYFYTTQDFWSDLSENSDDCNDENDGDYDGYDCDNNLNDYYS